MTLAIRLTKEQEWKLERLAKKTARTKSYYVRKALEAYFKTLEDNYLGSIAQQRLKNPSTTYYTMEEVEQMLGLDDTHRSKRAKKPGKARSRRSPADHHLSA